MKVVLEDPTRDELRDTFAKLAPGDEVEFRRYSRNRAGSWAQRYGLRVSTRQTTPRRPWGSPLPPSQDFVMRVEEKITVMRGRGVRQRLDDMAQGAAFAVAPEERDTFETAFGTLGVKRFEFLTVEGGELWVQRLPDAG